jgi:uncharacterized membrane protein
MQLVVEHDLRDASAVAEVDEDKLAEIAAALNPAHQDDFFICIRCAQSAAIICAFQISETFEQFCRPLFLSLLASLLFRRAILNQRFYRRLENRKLQIARHLAGD